METIEIVMQFMELKVRGSEAPEDCKIRVNVPDWMVDIPVEIDVCDWEDALDQFPTIQDVLVELSTNEHFAHMGAGPGVRRLIITEVHGHTGLYDIDLSNPNDTMYTYFENGPWDVHQKHYFGVGPNGD